MLCIARDQSLLASYIELGFSMEQLLSDWELSQSPFPELPVRLSERPSKSVTRVLAPRSFQEIRPWPNFLRDAASFATTHLDNSIRRNEDPMTTIDDLDEAADEIGVRVPLEAHIFAQTNRLATRLGLQFKYKQGGSGRSFSYTDLVILDCGQAQDMKQLSNRVFGNGEAKGPWQWDIAGFQSLEDCLKDTNKQDSITHAIQQLFGDMILDETKYGFITNYNDSVFFRRIDKILEFSTVVKIKNAPIEKFIYVLKLAEVDKGLKPNFSRLSIKDTLTGGTIGVQTLRPTELLFSEDGFGNIPTYNLEDLGVSGAVIGLGKFGNVVEGTVQGTKLAIKFFDLRFENAASAIVRELKAYNKLRPLQGTHVPKLLAVGRIAHTNIIFLALTYESGRSCNVVKRLQGKHGKEIELAILEALDDIHQFRVLHNDLKLSHILWRKSCPKFIDFDSSLVNVGMDVLSTETSQMEELLAEVREQGETAT